MGITLKEWEDGEGYTHWWSCDIRLLMHGDNCLVGVVEEDLGQPSEMIGVRGLMY
jgi:hypothetical protein